VHILKHESAGLTIIFCATRSRVNALNRNLNKQGIESFPLHGGLTQNRRKQEKEMIQCHKVDFMVEK
jgi:ATP-dependent RNA helicase DeaD